MLNIIKTKIPMTKIPCTNCYTFTQPRRDYDKRIMRKYLIYTARIDFPTGWLLMLAVLMGLVVVLGCLFYQYKRNRSARTRQPKTIELNEFHESG